MAEFKLTALCAISVTTTVEAETLEEAIEIANQRTDIMNGQFEHPDENESWVADEYDGVPTRIRLSDN